MLRLGNGLRALVLERPTARHFALDVLVGTGARSDPPGRRGLAHVAEHVCTRSTPDSSPDGIAGFVSTARTAFEHTRYHWRCAPAHAEALVRLASRRLALPALLRSADEGAARESRAVREEIAFKNRPPGLGRLYERLYREAFRRHPYRWHTLGSPEQLRGLRGPELRDFLRAHYHPANVVLVASGAASRRAVEELLRRYWSVGAPRPRTEPSPAAEPEQREQRRVHCRFEAARRRLLIGLKAPGFAPAGEAAGRVLRSLLLDEPLVERLRSLGARAVYSALPIALDERLLELFVEIAPGGSLTGAEEALFERCGELREGRVSARRFADAKSRAARFARRERKDLLELGELAGVFVLHGGDGRTALELPERVAKVRLADALAPAAGFSEPFSTVLRGSGGA